MLPCCGFTLQLKLHGFATSARVPSVSEKQSPPEEVWSQKVCLISSLDNSIY